ncbi:MAG TPA: glycoside hydrolase family 16 protein [Phytomonospora sp.]
MRPRRPLRRPTVITAVLALLASALVLGATAAPAPAALPNPAGWNLVFGDDFNGAAGTGVNRSNWIYDIGHGYPGGPGNWGTGEIDYKSDSTANVSLDGAGNLRITPIRDGAGNWTSGRIETQRGDFQPGAGQKMRIESRIQMPNVTGAQALGYWPAFWALGTPYRGNYWNWPAVGEFDIMENVNGINSVWGVLHCGVNPGGPCNETNGLAANRACPGSSCQSAFHTYTFEWDRSVSPNQLRWYVDGQQFHSVSQSQLDATTWTNMTNHGYFVILNVAMGGAFPNGVCGCASPNAGTVSGRPMVVDYVGVWTSGGGGDPDPDPGTGFDAYATIQAEAFSAQSGTITEATTDTGGGQNIGAANNGNWLRFNGVRFGTNPARQFVARVASGAGGGVSGLVEVRLGSPTGTVIGSFAIANTGGWQSWRTVPANIAATTGTHDVYLTFTSGQPADFVNVNWLNFGH